MKFAFAASVLVAYLGSSNVHAQVGVPLRAEVSILRSCVDTSKPDSIYSTCFGLLAEGCKRRAGADTTVIEAACISYEKQAWEQIFRETVRDTLEHRDAGLAVQVRRAQTAWMATRQADKNAVLKGFEGGNFAGSYAELADSREIAKRVQFFYENFS